MNTPDLGKRLMQLGWSEELIEACINVAVHLEESSVGRFGDSDTNVNPASGTIFTAIHVMTDTATVLRIEQ